MPWGSMKVAQNLVMGPKDVARIVVRRPIWKIKEPQNITSRKAPEAKALFTVQDNVLKNKKAGIKR
jgi:hypothetical protein